MLESLHVKNLALIDEIEVHFQKGLNILTGETGAGKSIIIGSIYLALGGKADKEMIRTGAEYALIELCFLAQEKEVITCLELLDLPVEEDGSVVLQRKISNTKSTCKINGEMVSSKQLKQLSKILIDIHGQHDSQFLLNKKVHMELLDQYSENQLSSIKEQLKQQFELYKKFDKEFAELSGDEQSRKKEEELLHFQWEEIKQANLFIGEDIQLEKNYTKMIHSKRIKEAITNAHLFCSYENDESAGNSISRALREFKTVQHKDEQMESLESQLLMIDQLLNDWNRGTIDYLEELEFDDQDFYETQERLNLINHLKSKYGNSIEVICNYNDKIKEKIEQFANYEQLRDQIEQKRNVAKQQLIKLCKQASDIRATQGKLLSKKLEEVLLQLNFLDVTFEIKVNPEQTICAEGYDDVEFFVSLNPGEMVKPLGNVASGGELSRIALAIKTIFHMDEQHKTLIFDEIDGGISGKTAWQVSTRLGYLGNEHQIICITHLPQIAAMADAHYLIEKKTVDEVTTTEISKLDEEASLDELCRLLGSGHITEAVKTNAKEMKLLAINAKQN